MVGSVQKGCPEEELLELASEGQFAQHGSQDQHSVTGNRITQKHRQGVGQSDSGFPHSKTASCFCTFELQIPAMCARHCIGCREAGPVLLSPFTAGAGGKAVK